MANTHSDAEGGHGGHDHTAGANSRSLTIALALTGTFLVAELVGAWLFNSLALLPDAAHMFTDAAALAIALAAIRIGRRPPPTTSGPTATAVSKSSPRPSTHCCSSRSPQKR